MTAIRLFAIGIPNSVASSFATGTRRAAIVRILVITLSHTVVIPVSQTAGVNADSAHAVNDSPSLFKDHLLESRNPKPQIHYTNYDYWVAGILFLSFVLFVWMYVSNRKRLNQLIKGFYINRFANQLSRDEYSISSRMSFLLSLMFLFVMTLFIGQVASYYGFKMPKSEVLFYSSVIIGLILIYLVKIMLIRIFGSVFKMEKEASEYAMSVSLFTNVLGLFMLPVVMCLAFVKQVPSVTFIYTGTTIILGFFCVRLVRGLAIGFNSPRVSKFYLFLYLCTLELLPFIIALKLFLLYAK